MQPVTAAAAAAAGLARCVREPGPWRPTKLRFDVETQRSPAGTASPFIAMHMEHPGSRHSNPASLKSLSRPFSAAWRCTYRDPGTTHALTPDATLRPRTKRAASSRSERRLFVHEPMKTCWIGVPSIRCPASRPV